MSKALDSKSPAKLTRLGITSCPLIFFSNSKQFHIHLFPLQRGLSMLAIRSPALSYTISSPPSSSESSQQTREEGAYALRP